MRYIAILKELKQKTRITAPVILIKVRNKDFYMASLRLFIVNLIFIDKSCDKLSNPACLAIMLHEMAHLKGIEKERDADMFVIRAGHAEDLLSFHLEHNKKHKKYTEGEGLTTKEVKAFI